MRGGVGWLFALAVKQMSAAINAMHDDPAHRWTLQKRAERVGMSRSIFALKFKQTVAASPMKYAVRSLCNMTDSLAQIGSVLGNAPVVTDQSLDADFLVLPGFVRCGVIRSQTTNGCEKHDGVRHRPMTTKLLCLL